MRKTLHVHISNYTTESCLYGTTLFTVISAHLLKKILRTKSTTAKVNGYRYNTSILYMVWKYVQDNENHRGSRSRSGAYSMC